MSAVDASQLARNATATLASVHEHTADRTWSLVVAHHPQESFFGRRIAVVRTTALGRHEQQFGGGVLVDENVSREHAVLELKGDQLSVLDKGSHNGTYLNGKRIQQATLAIGDTLELGRLMFVVDYARSITEKAPDDLPGASEAYLRVIASLRRPATRGLPLLLWGETGTGKTRMARFVHETRGSTGRFVTVRGSVLPSTFDEARALLEDAKHGTLFVEGLDEADALAQQWLVDWLDRPLDSRPGTPDATPQVIASLLHDPDRLVQNNALRSDLVHRFRGWRFRLPPLRERRVDIPILAQAFARRYGSPFAAVDQPLMLRLLRHDWPGNVRELEAILERAAIHGEGRTELGLFPELRELLRETPPAAAAARVDASHRVHREGPWYCGPDGEVHNLRTRKTLARVLAVLVEAHEQNRGTPLSIDALLARAWPDERIHKRAGANRVYVALTTLRKLGLRDLLVRTDEGYMLDPQTTLGIEND